MFEDGTASLPSPAFQRYVYGLVQYELTEPSSQTCTYISSGVLAHHCPSIIKITTVLREACMKIDCMNYPRMCE